MHPERTQYLLAITTADYKRCHKFLGTSEGNLSFPTIMAVRDNEIIGVLSTHSRRNFIEAGPLMANSVFTALRLIEVYESILKQAGITAYRFHVKHDAKLGWRNTLALVSNHDLVRLVSREMQVSWYERRLDDGWRHLSRSTAANG